MDIYVYMRGQRRGPYDKAQLEDMWKRGQIPKDTLYWHECMSQWALISDLFTETKVTPPLSTDGADANPISFPAAS